VRRDVLQDDYRVYCKAISEVVSDTHCRKVVPS